jgi:hypothetical protein
MNYKINLHREFPSWEGKEEWVLINLVHPVIPSKIFSVRINLKLVPLNQRIAK